MLRRNMVATFNFRSRSLNFLDLVNVEGLGRRQYLIILIYTINRGIVLLQPIIARDGPELVVLKCFLLKFFGRS